MIKVISHRAFQELYIYLEYALDNYSLESISEKLKKDEQIIDEVTQNSFLHEAVEADNLSAINYLLSLNYDVNYLNKEGFSPFHLAVINKQFSSIKAMLKKADINLKDANGDETVLHMVSEYRSPDEQVLEREKIQDEYKIAQLLIEYADNLSAQDINGDTALHKAVVHGNEYIVNLFLTRDYLFPQQKLLAIRNKEGKTVLHEAVRYPGHHQEILKKLLRVATSNDLAIVDNNGLTHLEIAQEFLNSGEIQTIRDNMSFLIIVVNDQLKPFEKSFQNNQLLDKKSISSFKESINSALSHIDVTKKSLEALVSAMGKDYSENEAICLMEESHKVAMRLKANVEDENFYAAMIAKADEKDAKIRGLRLEFLNLSKEIIKNFSIRLHSIGAVIDQYQGHFKNIEEILDQTDYFLWKQEKLKLPSGFPTLTDVAFFQGTDALAKKYNEATELHKTPQIENIEKSIINYRTRKQYDRAETAYRRLAIAHFKMGQSIIYENEQKSILADTMATREEKLSAHLALASLYEYLAEMKEQASVAWLDPISKDQLKSYSSFHYYEARQLAQGPLDDNAHVVLQREMGVTTDRTNMGTTNIQQCVVVVAHDSDSDKVVLSHFDRFSGPIHFIEQLLDEFAARKIDLYICGARDSSDQAKENIDQVFKQLYVYKDRFNIKTTDVGDKPSPEAIVFDHGSQKIVGRTPHRASTDLAIRFARFSVSFIKKSLQDDYLLPLNKVDFSKSESTPNLISRELIQINKLYNYCLAHPSGTKMWQHGEFLFYLQQATSTRKYNWKLSIFNAQNPLFLHAGQSSLNSEAFIPLEDLSLIPKDSNPDLVDFFQQIDFPELDHEMFQESHHEEPRLGSEISRKNIIDRQRMVDTLHRVIDDEIKKNRAVEGADALEKIKKITRQRVSQESLGINPSIADEILGDGFIDRCMRRVRLYQAIVSLQQINQMIPSSSACESEQPRLKRSTCIDEDTRSYQPFSKFNHEENLGIVLSVAHANKQDREKLLRNLNDLHSIKEEEPINRSQRERESLAIFDTGIKSILAEQNHLMQISPIDQADLVKVGNTQKHYYLYIQRLQQKDQLSIGIYCPYMNGLGVLSFEPDVSLEAIIKLYTQLLPPLEGEITSSFYRLKNRAKLIQGDFRSDKRRLEDDHLLIEGLTPDLVQKLFLLDGNPIAPEALNENFFRKHVEAITLHSNRLINQVWRISSDQQIALGKVLARYQINPVMYFEEKVDPNTLEHLIQYHRELIKQLQDYSVQDKHISDVEHTQLAERHLKLMLDKTVLAQESHAIVDHMKQFHKTLSKKISKKIGLTATRQTILFAPSMVQALNGDNEGLTAMLGMTGSDMAFDRAVQCLVTNPHFIARFPTLTSALPKYAASPVGKLLLLYSSADLAKQLYETPKGTPEHDLARSLLMDNAILFGSLLVEMLGLELGPLGIVLDLGITIHQLFASAYYLQEKLPFEISRWDALGLSLGFQSESFEEKSMQESILESQLEQINQLNKRLSHPFNFALISVPDLEEKANVNRNLKTDLETRKQFSQLTKHTVNRVGVLGILYWLDLKDNKTFEVIQHTVLVSLGKKQGIFFQDRFLKRDGWHYLNNWTVSASSMVIESHQIYQVSESPVELLTTNGFAALMENKQETQPRNLAVVYNPDFGNMTLRGGNFLNNASMSVLVLGLPENDRLIQSVSTDNQFKFISNGTTDTITYFMGENSYANIIRDDVLNIQIIVLSSNSFILFHSFDDLILYFSDTLSSRKAAHFVKLNTKNSVRVIASIGNNIFSGAIALPIPTLILEGMHLDPRGLDVFLEANQYFFIRFVSGLLRCSVLHRPFLDVSLISNSTEKKLSVTKQVGNVTGIDIAWPFNNAIFHANTTAFYFSLMDQTFKLDIKIYTPYTLVFLRGHYRFDDKNRTWPVTCVINPKQQGVFIKADDLNYFIRQEDFIRTLHAQGLQIIPYASQRDDAPLIYDPLSREIRYKDITYQFNKNNALLVKRGSKNDGEEENFDQAYSNLIYLGEKSYLPTLIDETSAIVDGRILSNLSPKTQFVIGNNTIPLLLLRVFQGDQVNKSFFNTLERITQEVGVTINYWNWLSALAFIVPSTLAAWLFFSNARRGYRLIPTMAMATIIAQSVEATQNSQSRQPIDVASCLWSFQGDIRLITCAFKEPKAGGVLITRSGNLIRSRMENKPFNPRIQDQRNSCLLHDRGWYCSSNRIKSERLFIYQSNAQPRWKFSSNAPIAINHVTLNGTSEWISISIFSNLGEINIQLNKDSKVPMEIFSSFLDQAETLHWQNKRASDLVRQKGFGVSLQACLEALVQHRISDYMVSILESCGFIVRLEDLIFLFGRLSEILIFGTYYQYLILFGVPLLTLHRSVNIDINLPVFNTVKLSNVVRLLSYVVDLGGSPLFLLSHGIDSLQRNRHFIFKSFALCLQMMIGWMIFNPDNEIQWTLMVVWALLPYWQTLEYVGLPITSLLFWGISKLGDQVDQVLKFLFLLLNIDLERIPINEERIAWVDQNEQASNQRLKYFFDRNSFFNQMNDTVTINAPAHRLS
jgi:ankyrin repeat protein